MHKRRAFTVGDLQEKLRGVPDDWEITFAGGLEFYGLEKRGERLINLEFMQTVSKDRDGNWHIAPEPPTPDPDMQKKRAEFLALVRREAALARRKAK